MSKKGSVFFKVILFILSIAALFFSYYTHKVQIYIYNEFKETNGKVLSSVVEQVRNYSTQGGLYYTYEPSVLYKYSIGNLTYSNSSVAEPRLSQDQSDAEKFLQGYGPGKKCIVYYDPKIPSRSVLYKRNPYGICIVFLIIAVIIWSIIIFYNEKPIESLKRSKE